MNTRISNPLAAFAGVAVVLLAANAHAASKVRVDKAADANFAACQTFSWQPQSEGAASLTDQRVQAAVMATLEAKGYVQVAEKPDCRISYVLTAHEGTKHSGPSVGVGAGGGSGGVGGGIGISLPIGRKKATGTITIDVIDATKNAQIWSGTLESTFKAQELTEAEIKSVVEKVLAEYPDRTPPAK